MLSLYRNETRMQKIGRFGVLIFLIFMFLFQLTSTGQNKKYFIITGKIVPEVATTESGIIEMSKSGAPITKITIPKNGRFRLELEYFNEYTLIFVLSQHFSKTIIVSTEIPQEVWERDSDFPPFPMVVQLFKEIEGIDKSFTLKASGKIFYGKQTDNFEKESYFSDVQMAEQIETAKAQTSQVAKEAQGITKQEAQDLVVKQKKFDQLIKDADVLYQRGEYQLALIKYLEAKQLFPERAYASDRIAELQDLVKALEITEKQKAELEQKYKAAIARANGFFEQKTYVSARPVYEEALQYKPGDVFANGRIQEIDQLLAMLEKQKQFNDLITQADNSYKSKNFDQAVTLYNQAKQLVPEKEYPQTQIDLINQEKEQLAKLEQLDKEYQEAIQMADQSLAANDLQQAKLHYQNALKFKASEGYPKEKLAFITESETNETRFIELQANAEKEVLSLNYDESIRLLNDALKIKPRDASVQKRIDDIQGLKKQQLLAQEKQKKEEERLLALNDANDKTFNDAMVNADKAFGEDDFNTAKSGYEKALSIKAADPVAKQKLGETEAQLAQLAKMTQAYNTAITAANKHVGDKRYQDAKEKYQEALSLKPEETLPKEQIAKIDALLQELLSAEETNRLYIETVNAGQEAFRQNKLKESRDAFMKARELKPSEPLPPIRIAELNTMIAQMEETARLAALEEAQRLAREKANREQYNKELAIADKAFAEKEYKAARTYYSNALSVLPNEKYPKDQISKIDELIAKQMEISMLGQQKAMRDSLMKVRDEAFNRAIASGKEMKQSKQYQVAIQRYNEAISIKPDERSNVQKMITALEDQLRAMDSQNKQFQVSIEKADQLFGASKLEEAIAEYRNASGIKPMEEYPKKQIIDIQNIIKQRNAAYDLAIENGDNAFNKSDLQSSKAAYTEALLVKPNEAYPEKRLREIDQKIIDEKLAGINSSTENAAYNEAVAKAEKALADNELTTAKMHFNVAHSLKPAETNPPQRIIEIDALIEQRNKERLAQAQRDIDEKYRQSISVADNAFREKTYVIARLRYQEAQLIKPDETYPKNQIALIDKLLNEAKPVETYAFDLPEIQTAPPVSANVSKPEESAQATEARAQSYRTVDNYDEAIRKADDSFGIKDYTVARFYYYKAIEIKPKEEYPVNQIELIRKLVDSELSSIDRSGYDKAIAQADEAFSKQDYTIAKFYYYKALEIKSWEKYPKDRIAEILALTNSLLSEREEKEYRDMIAKADEAYFTKDIAIARFYYNKAIAMKADENYPRIKLKDIQKLIDQDSRDQKNVEYNKVIEIADQALQAENFSIARFNYNRALGMKPDEKYPKDQLRRIKEALDKQNN